MKMIPAMNIKMNNKLVFACKSALWAVLLYGVLMCVCNWDDITDVARGRKPVSVINPVANPTVTPVFIQTVTATGDAGQKNIAVSILSVLRILAGFTDHAHSNS